jgi:hypothetical protein
MGNGEWGIVIAKLVIRNSLLTVILPCNMAFEAIMSGRTSTTWEKGTCWNSGETTTIRVPIVLKNDVLAYARAVDSKLIFDESRNTPMLKEGFLQEFTMRLIDRYIEFKRLNYHPNQNSRKLDTSTRAWDELRKFQRLVQESPELLG